MPEREGSFNISYCLTGKFALLEYSPWLKSCLVGVPRDETRRFQDRHCSKTRAHDGRESTVKRRVCARSRARLAERTEAEAT